MDRSKLNLGAYYLKPYACTEAHVKAVADCGLDLIVCMQYDHKTLDYFYKYGIGAIVFGVFQLWGKGNVPVMTEADGGCSIELSSCDGVMIITN